MVTLFHSNTERGFLHSVLKGQLLEAVKAEWESVRKQERAKDDVSEEMLEALEDEFVSVEVSEKDRDPYGFVINKADA